MAITVAKNQNRIWGKCLAAINGGAAYTLPRGANTVSRIKRNIWVNVGAPSGAAPTGMSAKDIIYDTTNSEVYRYISGTTYIQMTATS